MLHANDGPALLPLPPPPHTNGGVALLPHPPHAPGRLAPSSPLHPRPKPPSPPRSPTKTEQGWIFAATWFPLPVVDHLLAGRPPSNYSLPAAAPPAPPASSSVQRGATCAELLRQQVNASRPIRPVSPSPARAPVQPRRRRPATQGRPLCSILFGSRGLGSSRLFGLLCSVGFVQEKSTHSMPIAQPWRGGAAAAAQDCRLLLGNAQWQSQG